MIELQEKLGGKTPSLISLESLAEQSGITLPLGYSQVLFAPTHVLRNEASRKALEAFVEVSVEGWKACAADPSGAVAAVIESRISMGYPKEVNGVFDESSAAFQRLCLERCMPYVRGAGSNQSHYIDPLLWQKASAAMASVGFISRTVPVTTSLDTGIWAKSQDTAPLSSTHTCEITDGLSLARKIRSDVAKRSTAYLARNGRPVNDRECSLIIHDIYHNFIFSNFIYNYVILYIVACDCSNQLRCNSS